jgi:hypothetical protein
MKYETMGGEVRDTTTTKLYLRDLKVGEKFTNKGATGKWLVLGLCKFNAQSGSPTRLCEDLKTGERVQKQCRVEVLSIK